MHPIDRLAQIRAEMAALRQERVQLRRAVLHGEVALRGEHHTAQVISALIVRPQTPDKYRDG